MGSPVPSSRLGPRPKVASLRLYIWIVRSFARIVFFVYACLIALGVVGGTVFALAAHGGLPLVMELWFMGLIGVAAGFLLMVTLLATVEWMEATADTAHYVKELFTLTEARGVAKAE